MREHTMAWGGEQAKGLELTSAAGPCSFKAVPPDEGRSGRLQACMGAHEAHVHLDLEQNGSS